MAVFLAAFFAAFFAFLAMCYPPFLGWDVCGEENLVACLLSAPCGTALTGVGSFRLVCAPRAARESWGEERRGSLKQTAPKATTAYFFFAVFLAAFLAAFFFAIV